MVNVIGWQRFWELGLLSKAVEHCCIARCGLLSKSYFSSTITAAVCGPRRQLVHGAKSSYMCIGHLSLNYGRRYLTLSHGPWQGLPIKGMACCPSQRFADKKAGEKHQKSMLSKGKENNRAVAMTGSERVLGRFIWEGLMKSWWKVVGPANEERNVGFSVCLLIIVMCCFLPLGEVHTACSRSTRTGTHIREQRSGKWAGYSAQ